MNGVFHSLRGEFDVGESYSGQAVMEVILSTIKVHLFLQNDAAVTRVSLLVSKYVPTYLLTNKIFIKHLELSHHTLSK